MWCQRAASFALQPLSPVQLQLCRSYRKPLWLPVAKTKLFRIPKRPQIPTDEYEELKRVHAHYKTQMRAVRRYFWTEYLAEKNSLTNIHSEKYLQEEELELQKRFAANDDWNKQIAVDREAYIEESRKNTADRILNTIMKTEQINEKRSRHVEEQVQKQIELSSTFITLENLDEAIDKCLKDAVDYNFAIDLQGNYYNGRRTNAENITRTAEAEN
ncbi:mitochondrial ribosomal protein S26 [Arctopsyche grandis]|uniref:mitochondrial ribosomal protein S26 n=1 Tax=Arctopsyche grandis TaxID=121162 RepID=UPI00406D6BB4